MYKKPVVKPYDVPALPEWLEVTEIHNASTLPAGWKGNGRMIRASVNRSLSDSDGIEVPIIWSGSLANAKKEKPIEKPSAEIVFEDSGLASPISDIGSPPATEKLAEENARIVAARLEARLTKRKSSSPTQSLLKTQIEGLRNLGITAVNRGIPEEGADVEQITKPAGNRRATT